MAENNKGYSYKAGNASPLRYSPKRGGDEQSNYQQTTFNVTNVKSGGASLANTKQQYHQTSNEKQTVVSHSYTYAAGGSCGAAPTEKERLIASLMQEAAALRQRERDYKSLQD